MLGHATYHQPLADVLCLLLDHVPALLHLVMSTDFKWNTLTLVIQPNLQERVNNIIQLCIFNPHISYRFFLWYREKARDHCV